MHGTRQAGAETWSNVLNKLVELLCIHIAMNITDGDSGCE